MGDQYKNMLRNVCEFFDKEIPDLNVTAKTLQRPSADQVRRIYTALIIQAGFKNERQLYTDPESMCIIDDPHMGGTRTQVLNAIMEHFVRTAMNNNTWSIRDLSFPDGRRTLVFINELIVFCYFVQERYAELEEVFQEKRRIQEDELQLKSRQEQLSRQLQQKRVELDSLRRQKVDLSQHLERFRQEAAAQRAITAQTQQASGEHDAKLDALATRKVGLSEQMTELDEADRELRGKLVSSPDRLRAENTALERQGSEREANIQQMESSKMSMKRQLDILNSDADTTLRFFTDTCDDVRRDITQLESAQRKQDERLVQIDTLRARREKLQHEARQLSASKEDQLNELKAQAERAQDCIKHFKNLIQLYKDDIAQYTKDKEAIQIEFSNNKVRIDELKREMNQHSSVRAREEIDTKKKELESFQKSIERSNEKLRLEIGQLDELLGDFHKAYQSRARILSASLLRRQND